jgi:hypothetical protein
LFPSVSIFNEHLHWISSFTITSWQRRQHIVPQTQQQCAS